MLSLQLVPSNWVWRPNKKNTGRLFFNFLSIWLNNSKKKFSTRKKSWCIHGTFFWSKIFFLSYSVRSVENRKINDTCFFIWSANSIWKCNLQLMHLIRPVKVLSFNPKLSTNCELFWLNAFRNVCFSYLKQIAQFSECIYFKWIEPKK